MITNNQAFCLPIIFLIFSGSIFSSASATPPAKILSGIASNTLSALFKWLWSLKPDTKISTGVSSRSMVKYEGGYSVETVFDGSKLGIEPYSVVVTPSGEVLVLDSENSNVYKVSTPLSKYSRPKILAGSPEGLFGHVDGKPRESRMNHPKGLTVDDRGNVYVADTMNMAIRKISDAGVVTIAGGNLARGTGHIDGPSDAAKFSDDFDIIYVASSCSILVIDRGNQAIREIQLHEDDCSHQYDGDDPLGIAVLGVAMFFGFMLALLQRRVGAMFSPQRDPRPMMKIVPPSAYQMPMRSARPPLIPPEDEYEKEQDSLFVSLGKLMIKPITTVFAIFFGSSSSKKNRSHPHLQMNYPQPLPFSTTWPMQESFVIPHQDVPPPLETRDPSPYPYPFMTHNPEPTERPRPSKQTRYLNSGTGSGQNSECLNEQQQTKQSQKHQHRQQHHQKHHSSGSQTYYEKSETTNEVVFGAGQEQERKHEAVVIKAVDYNNIPNYNQPNVRSRYNYMGYAYGSTNE
ncbi:putative six-bladed beta-propeller, TolB [Helianthus annuus]|nr:putative six-bladed beta-propeller, TolB [Helianthus annuus]KAJ0832679.1 putative six-bladed beta-propeller, TolB [Helianthus annuus]